MYAFGRHEWLTYLKCVPRRVASRAVPSPNSTIMTLSRPRARLRASRCVMRSPPSSPSFRLPGRGESAKSPRPWMRLRPTLNLKASTRGIIESRTGGAKGGERRTVAASYTVSEDGKVGTEVGAYDRSRPLVIDPVLVQSTHIGGTSFEHGLAVAVDSAGMRT